MTPQRRNSESTRSSIEARNPGTDVYAQGVESENTSYVYLAGSEVFDNPGRAFAAGLTSKTIARFRARLQQVGECWLWQGAKFHHGYGMLNAGRFQDGRQDTRYTHRVAYQLAYGPIPAGLNVCHHCDNRPCCNPAHLFLGTQSDNLIDASVKGRLPETRAPRAYAPDLLTAALAAPRGGIADLARQYGVNYQTLAGAVRRARDRRRRTAPPDDRLIPISFLSVPGK